MWPIEIEWLDSGNQSDLSKNSCGADELENMSSTKDWTFFNAGFKHKAGQIQ